MSRKQSAHEQLEALHEQTRQARTEHRETAAGREAAKDQGGNLRLAIVRAHADFDEKEVERLSKAQATAEAKAQALELKVLGLEQRVRDCAAAASGFVADNASALFAELEEPARQAQERLARAAQELLDADKDWRGVADRSDALLRDVPTASPRADGPPEHRLASLVSDLRRAGGGEVELPLPRWQAQRQAQSAEQRTRLMKLRRERTPTEHQHAESDRLARDINTLDAA